MDDNKSNCKKNYTSADRCFTCQTKSNLLYLTTYPQREGSLREKSPTPGDGKNCEKQTEAPGCSKCKYYIEFISNLMDGIICDELQESKRKDGVHDCSTRPELDSTQKVKIVQKLYILFSDAQVAALGGRLKRRRPSSCSEELTSENNRQYKDTLERDSCEMIETGSPINLEVIPELESQCGLVNSRFIPSEKSNQKPRRVTSKENKVAVKRKSCNLGLLPKACSPGIGQRNRSSLSSASPSFGSQKSKKTSLSGCSCRTTTGSVASSDNRNVRLLSIKNRRSVENERVQQGRYDPSRKLTGEALGVGKYGRFKCSTVSPKISSPNCGIKRPTKNIQSPRNVRSEPFQKARALKSSTSGKKCCGYGVARKIQKSQSISKLKAESYDELVSEESNVNLTGLQKSFLYHTNSYGKCTSLVIAGSKEQQSLSDGSQNIRIDFETLKKRSGRK